jgi:hypothetical protein
MTTTHAPLSKLRCKTFFTQVFEKSAPEDDAQVLVWAQDVRAGFVRRYACAVVDNLSRPRRFMASQSGAWHMLVACVAKVRERTWTKWNEGCGFHFLDNYLCRVQVDADGTFVRVQLFDAMEAAQEVIRERLAKEP